VTALVRVGGTARLQTRIGSLAASARLHVLEADLLAPWPMPGADLPPVTAIFHLASAATPKAFDADPTGTLLTAVNGTAQALRFAARFPLNVPVVIASSGEVYGPTTIVPQAESTPWAPLDPHASRASYDEGKRAAEVLAMAWRRVGTPTAPTPTPASASNVDARLARIFATYGPGMPLDDGRVVATFARQALDGLPLTINGDGLQTRSLCYVDDVVEGLWLLAAHPTFAGPVNLGFPGEVTVRAVAEKVAVLAAAERQARGLAAASARTSFRPMPAGDPSRRLPDVTLAREKLGWAPLVAPDEGLARTVAEIATRVLGSAPASSHPL
jgi:dTDP-glucose 4,6-dehydratase